MDNNRIKSMMDVIAFFRSPMKAMSKADRNHIETILEKYPDITVRELVDCWINGVYKNS